MNPGTAFGARFGSIGQTGLAAFAAAVCAGLAFAWVAVAEPGAYRLALAVLLGGNLFMVSLRWPRAAAVATLTGLPFLALVRRMMISDAGWSSADPLLLVAPLIAIALAYRLFAVEGRPLAPDRLSKLVLALAVLTLLQTLNPFGAGLGVNTVGLLFAFAPLVWFFVGREIADRRMVMRLGAWIMISGLAIAFYGLRQTDVGFFSWDQQWVDMAGYAALDVGGVTRAFGTFSSAAEYAQYLGSGVLIAVVFALYRSRWPLFVLPLLAVAMFLSSIRTTLILVVVAILIVVILRAVKRPALAAAATVFVILLGIGAMQFLGPALEGKARKSQSTLVEHQLGGVGDPLNNDSSTLSIHAANISSGMSKAIHQPIGHGIGITTQASKTLNANPSSTELDISDAFIALGLFGGALSLVLIFTAFSRVTRLYWRQRSEAPLLVLGVLIVSFGQWLNGGRYAVSAIIWFLLGWAASEWAKSKKEASPS